MWTERSKPAGGACRVIYLSRGPEALYDLIRGELPPGCELVTLDEGTEAERCKLIADCDVAITAAYPLSRSVITAGKKLKLIHHQGVGYHDTIDLAALREIGVPLALTTAGTTVGVAEHAVLLILATLRRLAFADAELRLGRWHVNGLRMVSRELQGLTVGYVGMGRIGQAVARRLAAFDTSGLYADSIPLAPEAEAALGLRRAELDAVLAKADVITLHVPLTAETRHLINRERLAKMKPSAILVNTARGPIVDEAALAEALASNGIAGAGLDVFEVEPVLSENPLTSLPNVVLTPHISAGTSDAMRTKMKAIFANVERLLRGEPLENQVDLDASRAA